MQAFREGRHPPHPYSIRRNAEFTRLDTGSHRRAPKIGDKLLADSFLLTSDLLDSRF